MSGSSSASAAPQTPADQNLLVMCLLALAAGIIGGVGAWVFRQLIGLVHNTLFLGELNFFYNANIHTPVGPWGPWVIAVPVLGGLVVAWLVNTFAPEARGHGVPEVMDAIHNNDGMIRPRVAIIKSVASAISIGSGGAVGREGPIIQIGSAFGSMLGQIVSMPTHQRVVLIAAGSGAGIAATFNAPLGGVLFAIELLLISVNTVNVLLVGIATVTATHIGRLLLGSNPSFDIPQLILPDIHLHPATGLGLLVFLGIIMGLVSVAFIRGLYWAEDRFDAMPGNVYTRHALGMLCVGLMMYLLLQYSGHYYIQGVGYATIVDILTGTLSDPGFLLLLFTLKLAATCLSLGSGASGGVFSPALFMGATVGATFGQFTLILFPELGVPIAAFAIAGMAAAIGGTTGAVLTGIVMLIEMTGDQSAIMPLIIVVVTAAAVRRMIMRESIYTMKLFRRGDSAPEGLQAAMLTSARVNDIMHSGIRVVGSGNENHSSRDWILNTNGTVQSPGSQRPHRYIVAYKLDNLVNSLRKLHEHNADVILVTNSKDSVTARDLIGVIGTNELASFTYKTALKL